jgi:carbon storage regulator
LKVFQEGETTMLILNRKLGERIVIGSELTVTVLEVRGNRVKLGFEGPPEIPIHREEIHDSIAGMQDPGTATLPAFGCAECA